MAYDWRLSNRYNGERLKTIVEPALGRWRAQGGPHAAAQVVFVCHSMGGLVARWYIEQCGGAEVTRRLITLGTPWRGATSSLVQLINGVRKGIGPLAVDLSAFARSLPSTYQLLPEFAAIGHGGGWLKTTEYAQQTGHTVPHLDPNRLDDAMAFHSQLRHAEQERTASIEQTTMIVGMRQPTVTTVTVDGASDGVVPSDRFGGSEDDDEFGDATVPQAGSIGHQLAPDSNRLTRLTECHGSLHRNLNALDLIEQLLTGNPVRRRAGAGVGLRVGVPDMIAAGEPLDVMATIDADERHTLIVTLIGEDGRQEIRQPRLRGRAVAARFTDLPPGGYTIDFSGLDPHAVQPISRDVLVCDPTD